MARRIRVALFFLTGVLLSTVQSQAADGINFFKNYFVTGDYAAGFVDLNPQQAVNGLVSGTIGMSGVPVNADILAAYLYWETVTDGVPTSINAKFRGADVGPFAVPIGRSPLAATTAPCWSKQGKNDAVLTTWRVDVLRFLPIGKTSGAPNFGKRLVNSEHLTAHGQAAHTVSLPDSGTGNQLPESAGAGLVVIYRDPNLPLTGIVLYDGFHFKPAAATMSQTLRGFFERAVGAPGPADDALGRLSQFVSSGQPNTSEQISFNHELLPSITNPFVANPSSQRGFTALTLSGLPMGGTGSSASYGEEVTTATTHTNTSSEECLAWSAFVFSVPVKDEDRDGLLNVWESPAVSSLHDPDDTPLPNLYAMRARPAVQDIFVEIGFMEAAANTRYGPSNGAVQCVAPDCDPDGHTHRPARESLDLVATAFRKAFSPRAGNISGPVNIHFDVGNTYQAGLPGNDDARCLSTTNVNWVTDGCAIIPASLARGGEAITEAGCPANVECGFPDHPGTVSWKIGYRLLRDQPLNGETEEQCALDSGCQRRFDHNRRYMFRYALFAHALGVPMATTDDPATPFDETVTPIKTSGIADLPGGDMMITLGRWDDFTGTPFVQASTLMHEFGHSGQLRHGGLVGEPNCKPNYQTVMNYLFQARGLFTITNNNVSDPIVDYSRQTLPALNENGLNETTGLGAMAYGTRWYAPWGSSLIDTALVTSPAIRHCDGTPLSPQEMTDALAQIPGPLAMARVDGTTMSGPIDWSADGTNIPNVVSQDISFSGAKTTLNQGVNDWATLDLRHVGSRRNVAGFSNDGVLLGALSIGGVGADFIGVGADFIGVGADFLGLTDSAQGSDTGVGADFIGVGADFIGVGADFFGDAGIGPSGLGDVVQDAPNAPRSDLDLDTALSFGNAPHIQNATFTRQPRSVTLTVRRPHVGTVLSYEMYRVSGGLPITAARLVQRVQVGTPWPFPGGDSPTVQIVDTDVQNNQQYTYFVLANLVNPANPQKPIRSGISNYRVVITKQ